MHQVRETVMVVTTSTRVPGEGKNVIREESVALVLLRAAVLPGKKGGKQ